MKASIKSVRARRIWDSRGRPTIEVEVELSDGSFGRGIAPAGLSLGKHEAVDLRDIGGRFGGFDVQGAIAKVNSIVSDAVTGQDALHQEQIDALLVGLDPSPTKEWLGGNASIATSMAILKAAADHVKLPLWCYLAQSKNVRLPLPQVQIFGGGAHAGQRIEIQDLMIMPIGADSFSRALEIVAEVYLAAGRLMEARGKRSGVADEGGWWPNFDTNEEAIETLLQGIEAAGYRPNEDVAISLDLAASEFFRDGKYVLGLERRVLSREEWSGVLLQWLQKYPIVSVEDPFDESDVEAMAAFTKEAGNAIQIVGDDFLVTSASRIAQASINECCNAVLLKPNQVGTITETKQAMETARSLGWGSIVSARSGETEDTMITHLATGWDVGQLKVGSFSRSERMAKWNEALRIEDNGMIEVGYWGADALKMRKLS